MPNKASWGNCEGYVARTVSEERETDMAEKTNGAGETPAKVNKLDAVRQVMKDLGTDATVPDIQREVKARYGLEMSAKQASTYRGMLRKAAPAARKAKAASPAPARPANGEATVELEDLVTLRELVDRVGAERLRTLIDLLGAVEPHRDG